MYWKKNNKIVVDSQGRPISCSECPCGSIECREAVDNEVTRLLNLTDEHGQYIWNMGETYTPQYSCAEWHYDSENEEWVLDHMAEGKLAVALRVGTKVSHTTDSTARYLVYAKTLYSSSLEQWLTIGCECHVSDHACKHRKASLGDFNVAGLLDVYKPSESDSTQSYEPSDTCRVDICDLAKLKLQSAHEWHYGGTLYGEGFYDWWSSSTHTQSYYHFSKFVKALYWNDYETEESDSETIIIDHWKVTYIPCACDSQYPVHHELASDEKLHEYAGICDMESNCQNQALFTLRMALDSGDWEEVASVATDFVCAVYEGGTCVVPSSGHLCMAYSRPATLGYGTAVSGGVALVTATTIYNSTTNKYRTIGCKCNSESGYGCSQTFYDSDGNGESNSVCIGGILPVAPDNCDRNACATYPCDNYALQWACYSEWYGCTLYGEGYLLKGTDFTNYTKFSMALQGVRNGVNWYAYVDCGCTTGHTGSRYSDELPATWSLHELAGLCSNPECEKALILMQQAQEQGWTVYDEGLLITLAECNEGTETFGDWYNSYTACKMCADAGDCFYVADCSCNVSRYAKLKHENLPVNPTTNPADYHDYLEYPNACTCVDRRELYLTYPDVFGIVDVSYGNTSKYRYTTQSPHYDPETGEEDGTYTTTTGVNFCGQRTPVGAPCNNSYAANIRCIDGNFIDYRCFCYVQRVFNQETCEEKVQVRRIDPEGCHASAWNGSSYYDSAEFIGHLVPFQPDEDTGFQFGGQYYHWYAEVHWNAGYGFSSLAEAQALCASEVPTEDIPPNVSEVVNGAPEYAPHISPPNLTSTLKPCKYTERQEYGEPVWDVRYSYYGYGVEVSEDSWCCYRVQFMETNKGWLIYGLDGFHATFLRYGTDGERPEHYDPWESKCYNELKVARVDEDMHGCDPDFEWNFDEDSESQSDVSESTSVSQGE